VFGREGISAMRKSEQIAIFGLRAGDAVGDHMVYLAVTASDWISRIARGAASRSRAAHFVMQYGSRIAR